MSARSIRKVRHLDTGDDVNLLAIRARKLWQPDEEKLAPRRGLTFRATTALGLGDAYKRKAVKP